MSSPKSHSSDAEYFRERILAHTSSKDVVNSDYEFGHTMRRLFMSVKVRQITGLSEPDVLSINLLEYPSSRIRDVVRPYMTRMKERLESDAPTVEIAELLHEGMAAEHQFKNEFYRKALDQLSDEGKSILTQAYANQIGNLKITQTDYVSVASDAPDQTRRFLKQAVGEFFKKEALPEGQIGLGDNVPRKRQ